MLHQYSSHVAGEHGAAHERPEGDGDAVVGLTGCGVGETGEAPQAVTLQHAVHPSAFDHVSRLPHWPAAWPSTHIVWLTLGEQTLH